MVREQIQRLYFRRDGNLASAQAACRRLQLLTERGYLARVRLPVAQGSGPYVYRPSKARPATMDGEEGLSALRSSRGRRVESAAGLYHGLQVVDFYVALHEGLESVGGRILTWLGEGEARYSLTSQGKRILLSPDAYCLWCFGSDEGAFFLEWDRGTESITRLAQKLQQYEAYYRLQAYHDHVGEMGLKPRILIVVPDARRQQKLTHWLASRLGKSGFSALPTILVSNRDKVIAYVMGPIWHTPDSTSCMRLMD